MKTFISLIIFAVLLSCTEKKSTDELLIFELRLAQTEPDSSLHEMVFYNTQETFFVHDSVYLSNKDIAETEVVDWETQPKVKVILNETGKEKFADFTGKYVGKNAAMIVDNKLMSAPRINVQITKGIFLIVGFFNHEETQMMAKGILQKN